MLTPTRRAFLAASAAFLGGGPALARVADDDETGAAPAALPTIRLGRTGRVLPRLGFGGYPIGTLASDDEAVAVVRRAIELGVRYFDTAPSYANGRSERRIGRAVAASGVPRGELFLATKTLRRDADGARREVEESLARLGVDFIDSLSVHAVHDDVESLFGANAVLKGLEKTRDEGLIRHIGITGHQNPRWLVSALRRYEFATVLVPINPIDRRHLSFIDGLVPVAAERGVAVVAMKVYAGGGLLADGRFTAGELLRYALSQPHVAVAEPGCATLAHVDEAHAAVAGFRPLTPETQAALEKRAGAHRGRQSEWYKDERRDAG